MRRLSYRPPRPRAAAEIGLGHNPDGVVRLQHKRPAQAGRLSCRRVKNTQAAPHPSPLPVATGRQARSHRSDQHVSRVYDLPSSTPDEMAAGRMTQLIFLLPIPDGEVAAEPAPAKAEAG